MQRAADDRCADDRDADEPSRHQPLAPREGGQHVDAHHQRDERRADRIIGRHRESLAP